MRSYLKIISAILTLVIVLISCNNNQKEIDALNGKIMGIDSSIAVCQGICTAEHHTVDSFKYEIDIQISNCAVLNDSAKSYMKDNRMAADYIHKFDKKNIDILQEYIDSAINDKLKILVVNDLKLGWYGYNNQSFIDTVRNNINAFSQRKKSYLARISDLKHNRDTFQNILNTNYAKIEGMNSQKKEYESQLDILK